jgi:2-hydroxychromene-2-carboxylate isomerase
VSRVEDAFYFDLASAQSYLVAERILHELPGPIEWRPVLTRELERGRESSFRCEAELATVREDIERRARQLGLQPLRWPQPFPFDSELAMRAAAYAKGIGRIVPFALAAFRQSFAGGHSLEREEFVLIAAAACELHPSAVKAGARLDSTRAALARGAEQAARAGVRELPAVQLAGQVFSGDRALEGAIAWRSRQALAGSTR